MKCEHIVAESQTTMFPLWILYLTNLCYALPKRSLPASFPFMKESLGLTNKDYGDISAGFSLGYGLFKLIGGVVTDFVSAQFLFSCGLLAASFLNFIFPHIALMIINGNQLSMEDPTDQFRQEATVVRDATLVRMIWIFWTLNGILQGVGGPALSKVVIQSISSERRNSIWSNLHAANNIGYLLSPYMLLFPIKYFGWKGSFWFVGVFGFVISVCSLLVPCKPLGEIGNPLQTPNNDVPSKKARGTSPSFLGSSWRLTVIVICLVLSNSLTYFILKTVSDWQVLYTMEEQSFTYEEAITLTLWTEIGAILGTFLAAFITERYGVSKTLTCIMFATVGLICFVGQWTLSGNINTKARVIRRVLIFATVFGASIGLNCPKAMLFLLATEKSLELVNILFVDVVSGHTSNKFAGSISGGIGLVAQIGASCSGNIVGSVLSKSGWGSYIPFQVIGTCALVLLLTLAHLCEKDTVKASQLKQE